MTRIKGHAWLTEFALGVSLLASPALGWAKPSLAEQIARERQQLTVLQNELERVKRQRDLVSARERSVAERLEDTDRELAIKKRLLRVATLTLAQKTEDIAAANGRLAAAEVRADETRQRARARVRELAKWGPADYGRFLFVDPEDIGRRYEMMRVVLDRDRRLLEDAQTASLDVARQVNGLEVLKAELEASRREERERFDAVLRERETKQRLLRSLRTEKVAYARSISDLEEQSRRLEDLIADLVKASRPSGHGFAQQKGRLLWPAVGDIVEGFGRHKHPRFDTYVDRKGIELRVAASEPIRAVADGQVAYADRLKGYGVVVIVDHGEQYLSLYAHAAALRVRTGETVTAGQALGTARADKGDDRIYFELRHGEDPLDPLQWLLTRGGRE